MRKKFIAGNWKMNLTTTASRAYARQLVSALKSSDHDLLIAPPFTALESVSAILQEENSKILLGAQNMASKESGAYTGEISPLMLRDLGVSYVILGHSERRQLFAETDQSINEKVRLALQHDLGVILCLGESLAQRESGEADKVNIAQLQAGLFGVTASSMKHLVIAYEPVWAIGTGKTASSEDANAMHKVLRQELQRLYSDQVASNTRIQYGGSVKASNAAELLGQEDIDGALVGGASLILDDFKGIVFS